MAKKQRLLIGIERRPFIQAFLCKEKERIT